MISLLCPQSGKAACSYLVFVYFQFSTFSFPLHLFNHTSESYSHNSKAMANVNPPNLCLSSTHNQCLSSAHNQISLSSNMYSSKLPLSLEIFQPSSFFSRRRSHATDATNAARA